MDDNSLTDRQQCFVEEYLVDLNAGAAAARAGYAARSAYALGPRLRKMPQVRAAIDAAMAVRSQRLRITQDKVLSELARIAFADIRDFVSWDEDGVHLLPSAKLDSDQTACIAEIVENAGKKGMGLRIKLHGKPQALAALARHLGNQALPEQTSAQRPLTILTWVPEPELPLEETPASAGDGLPADETL
ncbi:MAG: terminase small subunit [Solidesulfovibrio sp.]